MPLGLNLAAERSEQAAIALLFGFGVVTGLAVAPTVAYDASTDAQAVWQAGGPTALFVAGSGAAGHATRWEKHAAAPHGMPWTRAGEVNQVPVEGLAKVSR